MQVVDGPGGRDELELAGVPVLVVERRGPVVGLVGLDCDTRARAVEKLIGIVGRSKVAAADYIVDVLEENGGKGQAVG